MAVYLSLLRGINVGGHRKIKMVDLKILYESLALQQVTTYIQSGNVVFSSAEDEATTALSARISNAIQKQFGFEVPVVLRTRDEMLRTVTLNPFTEEVQTTPDKVMILFADGAPNASAIETIRAKTDANIRFECHDNTIFCFYPDGYGQTKWHASFFEKQLRTTITARNWATTCKLAELLSSLN